MFRFLSPSMLLLYYDFKGLRNLCSIVLPNHSHGGDCPPAGCQKEIPVPMTHKSISKAPIPCACFLYDQTRESCRCWPENMEAITGPVGDTARTQEGGLPCMQTSLGYSN